MRPPSKAIVRMARSGIREIYDLAITIPGAIHLEMGEPDFPTPPHIIEAASIAAEKGHTKYTANAGIPELREAAAAKVRDRNGIEATMGQVVVTPGAIAALYGVMLALCDPGDQVLLPDPGWPNHGMICDLQGLVAARYPLPGGSEIERLPDVVEPLIKERTKVLLINSPSNPTGEVIPAETLDRLLELADRNDLWVVSDEVYDEIVFDGRSAPSAAARSQSERVVSVFSFSKTYSMTGWRVGYAVAPTATAHHVIKTQEPITACVNAPAQMAALAALEGPQECVIEMRTAYERRRDEVTALLDRSGARYVHPDGAFYIWIDISAAGMSSGEFATRLLREKGVAVTPGVAFGPRSDSHVRVSLAAAMDQLREGVSRLIAAAGDWAD